MMVEMGRKMMVQQCIFYKLLWSLLLWSSLLLLSLLLSWWWYTEVLDFYMH